MRWTRWVWCLRSEQLGVPHAGPLLNIIGIFLHPILVLPQEQLGCQRKGLCARSFCQCKSRIPLWVGVVVGARWLLGDLKPRFLRSAS